MQQRGQFKMRNVKSKIEYGERPSDETIRRVLRSAAELGVVRHYSNSPYYELAD